MYAYMHICIYMCMYIYIYTYREREIHVHIHMYIYIYIYIYVKLCMLSDSEVVHGLLFVCMLAGPWRAFGRFVLLICFQGLLLVCDGV